MQINNKVKEIRNPEKITGKNIIICEGLDAKLFIIYFLSSTKYVDYIDIKDGLREIEIRNFGGNSQLETHLRTLKSLDGFERVKSILIIRDAETNYNDAINEIKSALRKNDFAAPEKVCEKATRENDVSTGFLLFPTCSSELKNGTLEDLCLNIIAEKNKEHAKDIVNNYLETMKKEGYTELKYKHKNVLHSYLQAKDKFVTKKLGEAADAGAFDFKSPELTPLLDFIGVMIEK